MYQNRPHHIARIYFLPRSIIQELSVYVHELFSERTATAQEGEARMEGSMRDAVVLRQRLGKVGRYDGGGAG
jgi:hypothetical protein